MRAILMTHRDTLVTICIVSEVEVVDAMPTEAARGVDLPELRVSARKSPHAKCERCWNLRPSVGRDAEHPTLCERCVAVVAALAADG
jgi:isoleucyl-tRNA synthetase